MTKTHQHIYLSPHYDDAALSCGGAIHQQTQSGDTVLVITICAAPPPTDGPFSPFAQNMHETWGKLQDVITLRRQEDQAAMEILGVDFVWCNFVDCIYRGNPKDNIWFYNNDDQLFGDVHPQDWGLVDKIVAVISQHISAESTPTIYAPLAVGYHVDHQLTYAAAQQLRRRGHNVLFYEDYPYVDPRIEFGNFKLDDILARLAQAGELFKPQLTILSDDDFKAKVNSINAYGSQMGMLFGSQSTANWIKKYALQVGQGQLAERILIPCSADK